MFFYHDKYLIMLFIYNVRCTYVVQYGHVMLFKALLQNTWSIYFVD